MAKKLNEATAEGFALGYHLARYVDVEEQKESLPNGRQRCHNCAFRQGSYPNGSPQTTMDALKCSLDGTPFTLRCEWCKGLFSWKTYQNSWNMARFPGVCSPRCRSGLRNWKLDREKEHGKEA